MPALILRLKMPGMNPWPTARMELLVPVGRPGYLAAGLGSIFPFSFSSNVRVALPTDW